jgi:hypothetical protein
MSNYGNRYDVPRPIPLPSFALPGGFLDKFMHVSLFRKTMFVVLVLIGLSEIFGGGPVQPVIPGLIGFFIAICWIALLAVCVVDGGFYDLFYFKKKNEVLGIPVKKQTSKPAAGK